jgi:hypothetical protein
VRNKKAVAGFAWMESISFVMGEFAIVYIAAVGWTSPELPLAGRGPCEVHKKPGTYSFPKHRLL